MKIADIISDDIEPALSYYFENVDYAETFAVIGDYSAIEEGFRFYIATTYTVEEAMKYAKEEPAYPKADAAMTAMGDSRSSSRVALAISLMASRKFTE